jgi:hypothetical protein
VRYIPSRYGELIAGGFLDNQVLRGDGTTGIQGSTATLSDAGVLTLAGNLDMGGNNVSDVVDIEGDDDLTLHGIDRSPNGVAAGGDLIGRGGVGTGGGADGKVKLQDADGNLKLQVYSAGTLLFDNLSLNTNSITSVGLLSMGGNIDLNGFDWIWDLDGDSKAEEAADDVLSWTFGGTESFRFAIDKIYGLDNAAGDGRDFLLRAGASTGGGGDGGDLSLLAGNKHGAGSQGTIRCKNPATLATVFGVDNTGPFVKQATTLALDTDRDTGWATALDDAPILYVSGGFAYWSFGGTHRFFQNVDFDAGIDVTGNITVTGTVDGRDVAADGAILDDFKEYASMYVTGNAVQHVIAVAGTATQVLVFGTDGPSNGLTPDHTNDHITVANAGDYLILVSATVNSIAGAASRFEMTVQRDNGAAILGGLMCHRNIAGGGGVSDVISMSDIVTLSATDTIEVWLENETNTQNYVVEDISLTMRRVA